MTDKPTVWVYKHEYVLSEAAPALKAQLDRIEAKLDRSDGSNLASLLGALEAERAAGWRLAEQAMDAISWLRNYAGAHESMSSVHGWQANDEIQLKANGLDKLQADYAGQKGSTMKAANNFVLLAIQDWPVPASARLAAVQAVLDAAGLKATATCWPLSNGRWPAPCEGEEATEASAWLAELTRSMPRITFEEVVAHIKRAIDIEHLALEADRAAEERQQ